MPISISSRSPRRRRTTRLAWCARWAISRATQPLTMRASQARHDLKVPRIAPVAIKVLDVLFSIDMLFLLQNGDTPFRERNMHDESPQDFQGIPICPPESLEMLLMFV